MSGLPRAVLTWLQSLDLSFPIKNVKRDFSNGFLIAEIFSRYYKSEVSMHSYENGISIKRKRNNWEQLERFFKKANIPIEHSLVEAVILCADGAAAALVQQVYTFLTNKVVQPVPRPKEEDTTPAFARPTASHVVKERLRAPDLATNADSLTESKRTEAALRGYHQTVRAERAANPERYQPRERSPPRIPNRTVGQGQAASPSGTLPAVSFPKVEVRQLDGSAARLRASALQTQQLQIPTAAAAAAAADGSLSATGATSGMASATGMGSGARLTRPCMDLMNTCVTSRMAGMDDLKRFDPRKDPMVCFSDLAHTLPDAVAAAVLEDMANRLAAHIADNCLLSPREFWLVHSLLWTIAQSTRAESTAFSACASLISKIGAKMLERDTYAPFALFVDFALPKLADVVKRCPEKARALGLVYYSYCLATPEERLKAMDRLTESLDTHDLLRCLAAIAGAEESAHPAIQAAMLEHATVALEDPSADVRAGGIDLLSAIIAANPASQGAAHALRYFDRMSALSGDEAVVQASLCRLIGAVLASTGPDHPTAHATYSLLPKILLPGAPVNVVRAGLVGLSRGLTHHPAVRPFFVGLAIDRVDARERELRAGGSLRSTWHPPSIACAVADHVAATNAKNLTPGHMDLLATASEGLEELSSAGDVAMWASAFAALRDFVIVELCDAKSCEAAGSFLTRFFGHTQLREHAAQLLTPTEAGTLPALYAITRLVFAAEEALCHSTLLRLLKTAAESFPSHVGKMVAALRENETEIFSRSGDLQSFAAEFCLSP